MLSFHLKHLNKLVYVDHQDKACAVSQCCPEASTQSISLTLSISSSNYKKSANVSSLRLDFKSKQMTTEKRKGEMFLRARTETRFEMKTSESSSARLTASHLFPVCYRYQTRNTCN